MRGSNVSLLTIRPVPQQGHIRGSIPVSLVNNSSHLSGAAGSCSTVSVSGVWVGVENIREQEKLEARKMLENTAESHTSTARFVGQFYV